MAGVLDDGELRVWESIAVKATGGFALQIVCTVDDQHRGCDFFQRGAIVMALAHADIHAPGHPAARLALLHHFIDRNVRYRKVVFTKFRIQRHQVGIGAGKELVEIEVVVCHR